MYNPRWRLHKHMSRHISRNIQYDVYTDKPVQMTPSAKVAPRSNQITFVCKCNAPVHQQHSLSNMLEALCLSITTSETPCGWSTGMQWWLMMTRESERGFPKMANVTLIEQRATSSMQSMRCWRLVRILGCLDWSIKKGRRFANSIPLHHALNGWYRIYLFRVSPRIVARGWQKNWHYKVVIFFTA